MELLKAVELTPMSVKLLITSVVLFLIYDWWCHQYFRKRGVKSMPSIPIIGSSVIINGELGYKFQRLQKKYGRVFGFYLFRNPIFAITDAELLKQIMVKNFSQFINRRKNGIARKPLDKGLISLKDDHWKNARSVVSPAFSAVKMKQMGPMINGCCDALLENFRKAVDEGKPAECKALYGGFTMDSVAWCGFGLQVDSQKNKDDQFVVTAQKAFGQQRQIFAILVNMFPVITPVFKYLGISQIVPEVTRFFSSVTEHARKLRQDLGNDDQHVDMLQLLLNAHNETATSVDDGAGPQLKSKVPKRALTNDEVTGQAITFFLAGYETTNSLLGLTSYLLALNQDCQERLYAEIQEIAPTRDQVGYDSITKMQYLDMVISESLRYYPPVTGFIRSCNETFTYNGLTIEKGCEVYLNVYCIHHDEEYWPNPEKFDPERFSPEKKASIQTCTYMPFGYGPRSCVGMRFALLEAKMALVRVLQQYRLDVCPETQIPLNVAKGIFLAPKGGIKLRPVPRK